MNGLMSEMNASINEKKACMSKMKALILLNDAWMNEMNACTGAVNAHLLGGVERPCGSQSKN